MKISTKTLRILPVFLILIYSAIISIFDLSFKVEMTIIWSFIALSLVSLGYLYKNVFSQKEKKQKLIQLSFAIVSLIGVLLFQVYR
ncbi:hypothetical protein [Aureivirga sp. CE67]|uniref:hypothetical protein n=1 Tax=Aureivirga sp. CE67 TaxID=1788983 RepID=UPI0018CAF3B3|nr:hypothetical protein [Aureivirga sp. CE67]